MQVIFPGSPHPHLSWEATEEAVPEVHQREGKVLVEEMPQEMTHAEVGPASVDQQELLQIPKLSKGVIWRQNGLHPLLTADADADVGSWGVKHTFNNNSMLTSIDTLSKYK